MTISTAICLGLVLLFVICIIRAITGRIDDRKHQYETRIVQLKDVQFSMDLANEIDQEDFPLTYEMIHKNSYDETVRVRKLFRDTRSKPSAIVIYRDKYNDDNAMTRRRIFCFEVALGEHGRGFGHKLMEEIKWDADEITLGYLVEAKFFYIKEGFIESGENELKWKRSDIETEEE